MTLTLPIPPTANHLHTVSRGRKIKSQAARAYAHEVGWLITDYLVSHRQAWKPTPNDRLRVDALIYPKDRRKFDIANREKALLDSVFACLDADDSQVDVLVLKRMPPDPANPRVVLTLEAL